ncbi:MULTISPECIES: dienelactone hydrolase family protein [Lysinibacillus]|nr:MULTISPECIES: dienelactone hydrolase family protein [Lysinibacillus]
MIHYWKKPKGVVMKRKIFILHEIYGINQFIKEQAQSYLDEYTSVCCVSLYPEGKSFSYKQEQQAYDYFLHTVGFDAPLEMLSKKLLEACEKYDEVVLIGYSVGATLAWRLSTLPLHRVICVYGSRIRQFLDVQPSCPTLIILPSYESSFDVNAIKQELGHKFNVQTEQYQGHHGFMDTYNSNFCPASYLQAHAKILNFLRVEQH